jgi:hypothetical protein
VNCKNIIKKYLKDNGFDGLYFPGECACKIDDLVSCDGGFSNCLPGYLHPGDSDTAWYIKKEPYASTNQQEQEGILPCRFCGGLLDENLYCKRCKC